MPVKATPRRMTGLLMDGHNAKNQQAESCFEVKLAVRRLAKDGAVLPASICV